MKLYQISYPGNPLNYRKSIYAHILPAIPKYKLYGLSD